MIRRKTFLIAGLILFIGVIGWWLAAPLFFDNAVNEAFPFEMPSEAEMAAMSDAELQELEAEFEAAVPDATTVDQLSPEDEGKVEQMVQEAAATVMIETNVEEPMPGAIAEWTIIAQGRFVDADNFHMGSGNATIYQLGNESVLRFENFNVTNGPELHVILSKHPSPYQSSQLGDDYVDLGKLKGNLGDQNYDIPIEIALSEFQSVVIYCVPFHAVFSIATLK